jgi:sarcosine oxidase
MSNSFDVIVVGIGAMGSATCFHLARKGARVLGLEQFGIPHDRGSSHGHSRMIRSAYYEEPRYVPLLREAYRLWDELSAISGRTLLYRTGGLFIGPADAMLVAGSRLAAETHQLPYEMLSRDDLRRRFPQFAVPDRWAAMFDPDAGFLTPELLISTHAEWAMRHGAVIHAHEPIVDWSSDASGVTVRTAKDTYHAGALVFTAGAWSGLLLRHLPVKLQVTRQVLGWVRPKSPDDYALGRFPVWAVDGLDDGGIYYGFPMTPDSPGLKLAHHAPAAPYDPNTPTRLATAEDEADFRPALKRYLPAADGPLIAMRVCMYTMSPDEHFILDRHPEHERVQIACGFSGHGFKFASVIGRLLADRALGRPDGGAAEFLRLRRFG